MIYSLGDRKVITRGDYWVADNATVIGSVVLEHNASVWFNTVVRGDNDLITIGDGSNARNWQMKSLELAKENAVWRVRRVVELCAGGITCR